MTNGKTSYVIATTQPRNRGLAEELRQVTGRRFLLIDDRDQLKLAFLKRHKPRYIFFPHWSYYIPDDVFKAYECVIFHMTDLPFGRGGSPLQNLIVRGHRDTVISAIRCVKELDAGPIYLQKPLSLLGSAEEILLRARGVVEDMITDIVERQPKPVPQKGRVVKFRRRKPEQGNLKTDRSLESVFDKIRMLDAEGYPPAFLEIGKLRYEFKRVCKRDGFLEADVVIKSRVGNK